VLAAPHCVFPDRTASQLDFDQLLPWSWNRPEPIALTA